MDAIIYGLGLLKGYRTYLAALASVLTSIATLAGLIDPVNGTAITTACIAVAQIFHRIATSDHAMTVAEIAADVADLVKAVNPAAAAQPATIPMNGPQQT